MKRIFNSVLCFLLVFALASYASTEQQNSSTPSESTPIPNQPTTAPAEPFRWEAALGCCPGRPRLPFRQSDKLLVIGALGGRSDKSFRDIVDHGEAAPKAPGAFSFAINRYVLQIVSLYIVFDDYFPFIHKRALISCFPGHVAKPAHLQLSKCALFM